MLSRWVLFVSLECVALVAHSGCAAKAASLAAVTVCGSSVNILDLSPPAGSGPVVLMAAPCLVRDDGTSVIPDAYRRYIQLPVSRPLQGVWIPYDENTMKAMEADYRRLWDTGRLSDLAFTVTEHAFPNGVVGKVVIYTLKEQ